MKPDFFDRQRAEGTFDSEGSFTISAAAVSKLAKHTLPDPSYWLLKLVQAAVASGSELLTIKQTRHHTRAQFQPAEPLEIEEIQRSLSTTDQNPSPEIHNFVVGLQAVGLGQGRLFILKLNNENEGREVLSWDGNEIRRSSEPTRGKRGVELTVAWSGDYKKEAAAESQALNDAVRFCSMKIKLGGRVLNKAAKPKVKSRKGTEAYLAIGASQGESTHLQPFFGPQELYLKNRWGLGDKFEDNRPVVKQPPSPGPVTAIAQMTYGYHVVSWGGKHSKFEFHPEKRTSQLHWLRHGVICASEELFRGQHSICLHLYIDATDLPTDASGFALRDCADERLARRREATEAIGEVVRLTADTMNRRKASPLGLTTAGIGAFTLIHALFFPPPLRILHLIMFGIVTTSHVNQKAKILDNCRSELKIFAARFRN